jgi:hypothetical protein
MTAARPYGTVRRMGKFAAVVLTVLVIVELIVIIGIAGSLFWIGGTGTTVVATSMLVVSLVAGVLALRAMRQRR